MDQKSNKKALMSLQFFNVNLIFVMLFKQFYQPNTKTKISFEMNNN